MRINKIDNNMTFHSSKHNDTMRLLWKLSKDNSFINWKPIKNYSQYIKEYGYLLKDKKNA